MLDTIPEKSIYSIFVWLRQMALDTLLGQPQDNVILITLPQNVVRESFRMDLCIKSKVT